MRELMKYHEQEEAGIFCELCPHRTRNWSCPPHRSPVPKFLKHFRWSYIISTRLFFNPLDLNSSPLGFYNKKRAELNLWLLDREPAKSRILISGFCRLCPHHSCSWHPSPGAPPHHAHSPALARILATAGYTAQRGSRSCAPQRTASHAAACASGAPPPIPAHAFSLAHHRPSACSWFGFVGADRYLHSSVYTGFLQPWCFWLLGSDQLPHPWEL